MNRKKWLISATAGCLLFTSAAAGAGSLVEQVRGTLHHDVEISVDGEATALRPVYIDGKAYLPARDTAEALGYNLQWSKEKIRLDRVKAEGEAVGEAEEEADFIEITGVISSIEPLEEMYRLEVLGSGPSSWIILYADKETVITGADGQALGAEQLTKGMQIQAQYGPVVALSFPGQSHAASIEVISSREIMEGTIKAVQQFEGVRKIELAASDAADAPTALVLNVTEETLLLTAEGYPVAWEDLQAGTSVQAYYGPMIAKSMPPQSPLYVLVVRDAQ